MTAPVLLRGLSDVSESYDAVFCDVWGVVHDGRKAFVSACEALGRFRKTCGPVILITNAPVPKARVTRLFEPLGVAMDCFDDVVTSGDATRSELARRAPGPVYRIGFGEDMSLYEGLDLSFTEDPAAAKAVSCTSLREYPHGQPGTYRDELKHLAGHGAPMICANPDIQFRQGDRLIWSAGSLAAIYEEFGGEVIRPGKPDAPIYDLAMTRAQELSGRSPSRSRVLAIGDGPVTDLKGAMTQGFDCLFIGGGIHGHALPEGDEAFIDATRQLLDAERVEARYAMRELAW